MSSKLVEYSAAYAEAAHLERKAEEIVQEARDALQVATDELANARLYKEATAANLLRFSDAAD